MLSADAAEQTTWVTTSAANYFKVNIGPQNEAYVIGDYHNWLVTVIDRKGKAVDDAQINISGGMVNHGHGLPSQPLVSHYLGDGQYLIEGMLFNMSGQWTLVVSIQTPSSRDQARFDISLNF